MKILLSADLQLSAHPRDAYRFTFFETFCALIKKHKVTRAAFLGDLTEEKDNHGAYLTNEIPLQLKRITALCPLTLLRGNHDALNPEIPFFGWLGLIPDITWINNPTCMNYNHETVLWLPHTSNYERDWKTLPKQVDYIFAHNTFEGTRLANGMLLDGVPFSALPQARRVIGGDIHDGQTVGPLTYVGSPYLCDFGDDYDPRVLLLDTDTDKLTSIPVDGPQKLLLEVASLKELQKSAVRKGDVIKVVVSLRPEQVARWDEIAAAVRNWADDKGVYLFTVAPYVLAGNNKVRKQQSKRSDKELIRDYADARNIDDDTLNAGIELMEKQEHGQDA